MALRKKLFGTRDLRTEPRGAARLSKADWIQGELEALAEHGLSGLAVEALAKRLGVTKGSFYWHFRDADELLTQVVQRWEELAVDRVMADLIQLSNPCDVIRRIIQQTVAIDVPERRLRYRVEAAAAALAEWHPIVRPAYLRVTQRRLNGLFVLYLATGLEPPAAKKLSQIAYMTLVGIYPVLLALGEQSSQESAEMVSNLLEHLLPPGCRECRE